MNPKLVIKLVWSYIRANKFWFLAGLAVSFAAIIFFPRLPRSQSTTRIGLVGNYTVNSLPRFIQEEISFGLTRLAADQTATVGAALSWEATDSGKIFTFNLNPRLFWQDNQPLTSSQINYNLKGVTITRPSNWQIKFILKDPFAPLPVLLSQPLFKNGLVGLGKFKVTALQFTGRFLGGINLVNPASGETKIYKFYPAEETLVTALKLGAVGQIQGLYRNPNLPAKDYLTTATVQTDTVAAVFFNLNKKPFDDKNFRQSLVYALPKSFAENGPAAFAPVVQNSWVPTGLVKKYPHKNATVSARVKINLLTNKSLEDAAKKIAAAWTAAGAVTQVQIADAPDPSFDAYLTYLSLPPDPDQYALWHSTQTGNLSGYKSFKADKLLEEGRQTLDPDKRAQIYADFLKAITEDVPAAFLFYPQVYTISRK